MAQRNSNSGTTGLKLLSRFSPMHTLPIMGSIAHREVQDGKRVCNADYANDPAHKAFRDACTKAGVKPTRRQASKWRNKKGAAYKATH